MNSAVNNFDDLTHRQREILKYLITHYISHSEPVGSKTIAKHYINDLSSATIRNVLEEMERRGYLYKPHTSAGRIPTEKSFKFFVSEILRDLNEKASEIDYLNAKMELLKKEKVEMFNYVAKLLAQMSHNAAIMLLPRFDYTHIMAVDFFKMSSEKVLVVAIFDHGFIEHKVVDIDENYSQEQLTKYANHINRFLERRFSLDEIREHLLREMKQLKVLFDRMLENLNNELFDSAVIVEGQSNLFDAPEFASVKEMKRIFKLFEERSRIVSLLDSSLKVEGVKVFIGSELSSDLDGTAMVTAPYRNGDNKVGTIGVFGPVRMDYARILPLVISAANMLSRNLTI